MKKIVNFSTIPEIIEEAKQGKMFILIDDENRENEGDLVIPAQKCNASHINFMATFGRGLICLALTEKRINQLELSLMSGNNQSKNKTAFTVSIEAKEGISTGISAYDRAKTIEVAINPNLGKENLVSPGHIFPLKAQNGGVLVRAGHTEASVDLATLANLNPSAVICEIMSDDGTMARLPQLLQFAYKHKLKIATIADLIEYRRKNEKLIELVANHDFNHSIGKNFLAKIYRNILDGVEHIAFIKGNITTTEPILVRMHHLNIVNDCFNWLDNPKNNSLNKAFKKIAKAGCGVIVVVRQPTESISDFFNLAKQKNNSANILRNYGIGAQILADLQIKNLILLSNNKQSVIGLEGYEIKISGYRKLY
jgi:3,4-dihydroxy 2-butanone 4-phosphate synthase/GTP cyclohydrolase II